MRTYLDHAATTPLHPQVAEQLARDVTDSPWLANPAALHSEGRRAHAVLQEARARLAHALGVHPHEVIITSGGTEADALAISGRARSHGPGSILLISAIEHPAVSDSARTAVMHMGAQLGVIDVDSAGRLRHEDLARAVAEQRTQGRPVSLVSVMAANNETGMCQDMAGIVQTVREASGAQRPHGEEGRWYVPVHSDIVAALGHSRVDIHGWGIDAASISGHKIGAPVGVGALIASRALNLTPPVGGGRQERGVRSGTQSVLLARALALAVELAVAEQEREAQRLGELRDTLMRGLRALPGVHDTLGEADAGENLLPSTAHVWCEGVNPEALLMALDMAGVDASAGSACHAGVTGPSHVLEAMGVSEEAARGPLRFTLGRTTTAQDIEAALAALPAALETARGAYRPSSRVE